MGKIAFVFPGQGAQYPGMARQITQGFSESAEVFEVASDALGIDMGKMVFEGSEDTLKITENTQPAILTASIACLKPLSASGIIPDMTAGLSLGEYTALVAAGAFDFKDAVKIVRKRGKFMQEAVPVGTGTMAAIIGLENEVVMECCKSASEKGVVEPANFNCPGQIVISGQTAAVEKAVELCNSKGARRAMLLQVSAPFHCSLMKPAGEKLEAELSGIKLNKFNYPVVSNVTALKIDSADDVKGLLVRQVSSPVRWEDSVRYMLAAGIDTFVEIGPGKVLGGFVRKISKEARILNVEDMESLNNAISALKNS